MIIGRCGRRGRDAGDSHVGTRPESVRNGWNPRDASGFRFLLLASVWIFCALASPAPATGERPNILLFIADDLTWHDVGPMGNDAVRTPHLDRLAKEGILLTRMFTGTAMCSPTRQQIYTGLHPVRSGAYPNHSRVYEGVRSLAHHAQDLGYAAALKGKRHYGPPESFPFEHLGGMHHDPGPQAGPDLDLDRVKSYIEEAGETPWCVVVATNQPHTPWNRGDAGDYDPADVYVPPYLLDIPATRRALTRYYAEITYMDSQVGRMLEILDETGTAENTVVIWTSEQGAEMPFAKWTCYDAGLRTPTIIRWPGVIEAGGESAALVEYIDVAPTLVRIAGGDPETIDTGIDGAPDGGRGFDGRSFLPVLLGETVTHKEYVFGIQTTRTIHQGSDVYPIRSVRDERYKLIWNLAPEETFRNLMTAGGPGGLWNAWVDAAESDPHAARLVEWYQRRPEFEFYDLESDPYETTNLIDEPEHEATVERLRKELESWMDRQGDLGRETELMAEQRLAAP